MPRKKTQAEQDAMASKLDGIAPEVDLSEEREHYLPEDGHIRPETWKNRDPKGFTSRSKYMSFPLFLKDAPSIINDILECNSAYRLQYGWSESETFFYMVAAFSMRWQVGRGEEEALILADFAERVRELQRIENENRSIDMLHKWRKQGVPEPTIRNWLVDRGAEDVYYLPGDIGEEKTNDKAGKFLDLVGPERAIVDAFVYHQLANITFKQILQHCHDIDYVKDTEDRAEVARLRRKAESICDRPSRGVYSLKGKLAMIARWERRDRDYMIKRAEADASGEEEAEKAG